MACDVGTRASVQPAAKRARSRAREAVETFATAAPAADTAATADYT